MARARLSVRRTLADYPTPTPQPTPCRLWQGPVTHNGYGYRTDRQRVHRWVWEQVNGPIPTGMRVLHRCDQPLCYRLDHLFLGTDADNTSDMLTKGRHRVTPQQGESNPAAKLCREEVEEIRVSPESSPVLARRYGVAAVTIRAIRQRRIWKHIHP